MSKLRPADDTVRKHLAELVPESVFRDSSERYLEDPRRNVVGVSGLVLAPDNVQQVSDIVRACASFPVPVIPYGGGTGLVGGQIMIDGPPPVVVSLEKLNSVRDIFVDESVIVVEAGMTLFEVQQHADQHGLLFPLSLASEGSCRIGGNLATNAGGVNVLRYGNSRDLCIGLEAVLPSGEIWHGLTRLRKDNTGYDIRDLLIGSEGTLGIITAASLKLFSIPAKRSTAMFAVQDPAAALSLLSLARHELGEMVSSFELIKHTGLEFMAQTLPDIRLPFADIPAWMVLIELGVPDTLDADAALLSLFETAVDRKLVHDGVVAQSRQQSREFWHVREHLPEANRRIGAIASHDVSLPLSKLPEFIDVATAAVRAMGEFRVNCFGHLGDGNLHFNVFPPDGEARDNYMQLKATIERCVHDIVHSYHGSFSAEHGIGRNKVEDLQRYGDPVKLSTMRMIKQSMDPAGIMNPGAVLPLETGH